MPITTNTSIAQAKVTMLAQTLLRPLVESPILSRLMKSDTDFMKSTGAYQLGATISIPVIPAATTTIATATGGAISAPKLTLTNVSLTLESLAITPFSINGGDVTLANVDPTDSQLVATGENHAQAVEKDLFLKTFNDTTIDLNSLGTVGQAANYKLLRTIWLGFKKAKVPESVEKMVVFSPDQYSELLSDPQVARLTTQMTSEALATGILDKTLNIRILCSTNLPTSTELTNITGTGTNQVGFAFTADSIVIANRRLPTNIIGTVQQEITSPESKITARLTISGNAAVAGMENTYTFESLYGSKIYRPTTVFPIFGGVA